MHILTKLFLLALITLTFMGCMLSSAVDRDIVVKRDLLQEFNNPKSSPMYLGRSATINMPGSQGFMKYYFPDPLLGQSGRTLVIAIPSPAPTSQPAELYDEIINDEGRGTVRLVLMPGAGKTLQEFLVSRPDVVEASKDWPVILLEKNSVGGNEGEGHFDFLHISDHDPNIGSTKWRTLTVKSSISKQVRSDEEISNLKMKYFYTVPLDIVTFPFQFIMVIILGPN
jgi:hypothetical protein